MEEITDNLYMTPKSMVNVYLYNAGGQVALIDSGAERTGKRVLNLLSTLGLGPEDVRHVLLTHGHYDHVRADHLLPNATIYAHKDDVPLAEGREKSPGRLLRLIEPFAKVDRVTIGKHLEDGDEVTIGHKSFKVIHTPGHTRGSVCYLLDNVLFSGDTLLAWRGKLTGPQRIFSADMTVAANSMRRLLEHDFDIICPGHGKVLKNGRKLLENLLSRGVRRGGPGAST